MNEHVFIEYSLCVGYGAKGEKHKSLYLWVWLSG